MIVAYSLWKPHYWMVPKINQGRISNEHPASENTFTWTFLVWAPHREPLWIMSCSWSPGCFDSSLQLIFGATFVRKTHPSLHPAIIRSNGSKETPPKQETYTGVQTLWFLCLSILLPDSRALDPWAGKMFLTQGGFDIRNMTVGAPFLKSVEPLDALPPASAHSTGSSPKSSIPVSLPLLCFHGAVWGQAAFPAVALCSYPLRGGSVTFIWSVSGRRLPHDCTCL